MLGYVFSNKGYFRKNNGHILGNIGLISENNGHFSENKTLVAVSSCEETYLYNGLMTNRSIGFGVYQFYFLAILAESLLIDRQTRLEGQTIAIVFTYLVKSVANTLVYVLRLCSSLCILHAYVSLVFAFVLCNFPFSGRLLQKYGIYCPICKVSLIK